MRSMRTCGDADYAQKGWLFDCDKGGGAVSRPSGLSVLSLEDLHGLSFYAVIYVYPEVKGQGTMSVRVRKLLRAVIVHLLIIIRQLAMSSSLSSRSQLMSKRL